MKATTKNLDKGRVELTVTVTPEEQQPHLIRAAAKLSAENKTPGFRPGNAPYDVVVAQIGEMKILDAALESIVRSTFVQAVKEHALNTIGMPEITFEKVAPKNELVYHAAVSLMPTVTLPNLDNISVEEKNVPVTDAEVEKVLNELQRMHAIESISTAPASKQDKVTVDMDLFDDAVPLEGGQAHDHGVYLDEPYYIPGFTEKLIGTKSDDELSFVLPFPKDHYQKLYAGKNINFKVKVKKVETRALPEIDDAFAGKMGVNSATEMKTRIRENIAAEHHQKAAEATEIEMLQKLVAAAKFTEIPDLLVEAEQHRLMHDLEDRLQKHGLSMEQYLQDLKKTPAELQQGFADQALNRVKMYVLTHAVAEQEKITVTPEELQNEIEAIREAYKNNADAIKRLPEPTVQESIKNSLTNRKVMEWLHHKIVKHV